MAVQVEHRAIDTPLEHLPPIDEHAIEIDAPAESAWAALFPTLGRTLDGWLSRRVSGALGCRETEANGDLHHPGGTLPGFVVSRAVAPVMLALVGEHRFSRYAFVFRIDLLPGQRCRVRAETRAEFPGAKGTLYKAAVIGTQGHVVVVRSILRSLKKRAERRADGR
jgi:hypothetical protein